MSSYRTHHCNELRENHVGQTIKLSGWVHKKRDHGNLLFIDLRDHYGITQCVLDPESNAFETAEKLKNETIITIEGEVKRRDKSVENPKIPTGFIEVSVNSLTILSQPQKDLPLPIHLDDPYSEEIRLKYRYLDLRRPPIHERIVLRSNIIQALRQQMLNEGFLELQTPILTASSPEGARDYVVPSRKFPGKFYALPQAPQQFKQLYMVSGFDRYFQIAPCFRDEDARADRSPGEFYQLDLEMAFATQEDVFQVIEKVLYNVFSAFSNGKTITKTPFPQITFEEAMRNYGTDKPDLRNPLKIIDVSQIFKNSDFSIFAKAIDQGQRVLGIPVSNVSEKPRSFFDKLNNWARSEKMAGLGYVLFQNNEAKGPIAKFLNDERKNELLNHTDNNGAIFFICSNHKNVFPQASLVRNKLGSELDLIEKNTFKFCWITDFPMFEINESTGKIDFSHNPFSMPQGGLKALNEEDPLKIKAFQYDIVCNGTELSSGAIRNHSPEILYKAFEIAGHTKDFVDQKFSALINAFKYGAPPHGGIAPGIDRIVMLLAGEENLREITAFPMNQNAQDLMMEAPNEIDIQHLKELSIKFQKNNN